MMFSYVTGKDKGLHLHPCFHGHADRWLLKARMKAYADFNDYQIVGEYEDAGKLRCLGVFSVGFGCQKVKCHENKIFFRATPWPFRCNYCYCILFSI